MKAQFRILKNEKDYILIEDLCEVYDTMSITNDAEAVVVFLLKEYNAHDKILYYVDTEDRVDILVHDGIRFKGFAPGYSALEDFYESKNNEV